MRFLPIKGYYLDPNSLLLASIPSCPRDFRLGLGDEPGAPARSRAHEAVGEGDRVEDEREQREPGMTPSHRSIGRVLLPLPLFPGFPRTQDGKSRMRRNPKKPYMHFGSQMEVSTDEDRLGKKRGWVPTTRAVRRHRPFLSGFWASSGAFDVCAASEDGGGGNRRICQGGG